MTFEYLRTVDLMLAVRGLRFNVELQIPQYGQARSDEIDPVE